MMRMMMRTMMKNTMKIIYMQTNVLEPPLDLIKLIKGMKVFKSHHLRLMRICVIFLV